MHKDCEVIIDFKIADIDALVTSEMKEMEI